MVGQAMAQVLKAVEKRSGAAGTTAGIVRLWAECECLEQLQRQVGLTSSNSGKPTSSDMPCKLPALGHGPVLLAPSAAPRSDPERDPVQSNRASLWLHLPNSSVEPRPLFCRCPAPRAYSSAATSAAGAGRRIGIDTERRERQPSGHVGTNPPYSSGSGSISTTLPSRITTTPVPVR